LHIKKKFLRIIFDSSFFTVIFVFKSFKWLLENGLRKSRIKRIIFHLGAIGKFYYRTIFWLEIEWNGCLKGMCSLFAQNCSHILLLKLLILNTHKLLWDFRKNIYKMRHIEMFLICAKLWSHIFTYINCVGIFAVEIIFIRGLTLKYSLFAQSQWSHILTQNA